MYNWKLQREDKIIAGTLLRKLCAVPSEQKPAVKYWLHELLKGREVNFKVSDFAEKMARLKAYRLIDNCGSLYIPVLERYELDSSGERVLVSARLRGDYNYIWPAIEGGIASNN